MKFGSVAWVLKKREEQRLEAAQMKFLRHLLGITKLDKEKNECIRLQPGHYSSLTAPNLQPTANQERNNQCGNQHHSRELLSMGIVVPETC